jgi:hypothetical protein
MIIFLAVLVVAVVVAAVVSVRLSSARVRRRSAAANEHVTRVEASSNVRVLADYRKARARHERFPRSAEIGMPGTVRSRPGPA